MRPGFLGVSQPVVGDDETAAINETLRSGWVIAGPRVAELERDLAAYLGTPHVRCLGSCTAGLTLALRLAGVRRGDDVVLPANTFVACANVVEHAGATPVFVDIDPATGLVDLDALEGRIGPRTRAVIAVHLAGRPVDLDRLAAIRDRYGVTVIEDAAHAIGAAWDGRRIGAHGNLCAFSFHATKNMTTFEGGALTTPDAAGAERAGRLALQGLDRSAWKRHGARASGHYDVAEPGFKFPMTDVGAAAGVHQLRRLEGWNEHRAQLAARYDDLLGGVPVELLDAPDPRARHAHHIYVVKIPEDARCHRDEVVEELRRRNIGSSVHFRGIHLYSYYRECYGLRPEDLPAATDWSERALTLPLHAAMVARDVDDVVDALADVLTGC